MGAEFKNEMETLLRAGTAVISDVYDNLGQPPRTLDVNLFSVQSPMKPFAGPAYTITGQSHAWSDGSGDRVKLKAIDEMTPGVVPVWAGQDIRGVCCFGDLLAEAMKARGVAGVVVDGGVRDTAYLREMGLPLMTRYRTPSQSIGRWRVTGVQETVKMRGATQDWVEVSPGDLVVADDDGVALVPKELITEFADKARAWADKDQNARQDIKNGAYLLATLDKYGHL